MKKKNKMTLNYKFVFKTGYCDDFLIYLNKEAKSLSKFYGDSIKIDFGLSSGDFVGPYYFFNVNIFIDYSNYEKSLAVQDISNLIRGIDNNYPCVITCDFLEGKRMADNEIGTKKLLLDWFDFNNMSHLRAFLTKHNTGSWPIGFIPDNVYTNELQIYKLYRRLFDYIWNAATPRGLEVRLYTEPTTLSDIIDLYKESDVEAVDSWSITGKWPVDFIPKDFKFFPEWETSLMSMVFDRARNICIINGMRAGRQFQTNRIDHMYTIRYDLDEYKKDYFNKYQK